MKSTRVVGWGSGIGIGLLVLEIAFLRALPYSTSWIENAEIEEISVVPTPNFQIRDIEWSVTEYQESPALGSLRKHLSEWCPLASGLDAAQCVSEVIAEHSELGSPPQEFFDATYSPALALEEHLAGKPGHCVTRSGLVAAALLSAGIPAVVVQVIPRNGAGHNIVGVWDRRYGWTLVDPTVPGLLVASNAPVTIESLLKGVGDLQVHSPRGQQETHPALTNVAALVLPEPWLYVRVGEKATRWPFRGAFVMAGNARVTLGPAQKGTLGLIFLTVVAVALLWCAVIRHAIRSSFIELAPDNERIER